MKITLNDIKNKYGFIEDIARNGFNNYEKFVEENKKEIFKIFCTHFLSEENKCIAVSGTECRLVCQHYFKVDKGCCKSMRGFTKEDIKIMLDFMKENNQLEFDF